MLRIEHNNENKTFHLSNGLISYVIRIEDHNILNHIYFGEYIEKYSNFGRYPRINRDFEVNFSENEKNDRTYSVGVVPLEYPAYGTGDFREPAILLKHADGSIVSDFRYESHEVINGTSNIKDLPSAYVEDETEAKTLIIKLNDSIKNNYVYLKYTIFDNLPTIVRSTEIFNNSEDTQYLDKAMSLSMDFQPQEFDLLQLNGAWARERMVGREKIKPGIKRLDSKRGTSSHHQSPFLALLDPNTTEKSGEAYGFQLIYSGSHEMTTELDPFDNTRVQLGIQSLGFSWKLDSKTSFQTPEAVMTYSPEGINGMSKSFHQFIKKHIIPRKFATKNRPVLINNWEGTYFDFTEEKLKDMIDISADLGIELFVLDDGWFGKRDDDTTSLGDWHLHQEKLPNGLNAIADYVHDKGMQFGLWFEPEMISEESNLYEKHPDWALQVPDRSLSTGRSQYVLDFSREDVREHIYDQMLKILKNVEIDYIKWDMNRHLSEVYSLSLPSEQAGEVMHRYMLGLYEFMDKLVNEFPDILFESCSGGGGRFDLGLMPYMPQVWTSDNTDPIARLKIQYGTSMIAPINTMGAHVSTAPNHQTGRLSSLKMRAEVAFAGVFGYELDVTKLTKSELAEIEEQIKFYKEHRELIQQGEFTRLLSPFEGNEAAWMLHNEKESLVFFFEVLAEASKPLKKLKIPNLKRDKLYKVTSEDEEFTVSGSELENIGIYIIPRLKGDFQSRLFKLELLE